MNSNFKINFLSSLSEQLWILVTEVQEVQVILSILNFCILYNRFSKIDGDFTFKFTNLQKQIIL